MGMITNFFYAKQQSSISKREQSQEKMQRDEKNKEDWNTPCFIRIYTGWRPDLNSYTFLPVQPLKKTGSVLF